jgi:hypothetical protein
MAPIARNGSNTRLRHREGADAGTDMEGRDPILIRSQVHIPMGVLLDDGSSIGDSPLCPDCTFRGPRTGMTFG